jgi:hypothetical protein
MAVVLDLVTDALSDLGVLAASESATAADADSGLRALNRLVDQWAAERLAIYQSVRTTFAIAAATQTYLVGTGQVVNVARPVFLDQVRFSDSSTTPATEYPLDPLTDDAWAAVPQKTLTSPMPAFWHYKPSYPYGTLTLWPVPTATTLQGVLCAPQAVAEFSALSTEIALPPGYRRMLVKSLALDLAPSYGRQVNQALAIAAQDALAVVKRANRVVRELGFTADVLSPGWSYFDINTGA